MKKSSQLSPMLWRLIFAAALVAVALLTDAGAADYDCTFAAVGAPQGDSWIFARSRFSHDPDTGVRVAQYAMKPPVEPLPDQRAVTSGYRRSRSVLRGADGSSDTTYQVQNYGNGRGGLDAEWERFHDAWRGSTIAGGSYQGFQNFGYGGYGGFPAYGPGPGYGGNVGPGFRNHGFRRDPRAIYGPGYGQPDAGRLDPDAADGYRERRFRTPDRQFFNQGFGPRPGHHGEHHDEG